MKILFACVVQSCWGGLAQEWSQLVNKLLGSPRVVARFERANMEQEGIEPVD